MGPARPYLHLHPRHGGQTFLGLAVPFLGIIPRDEYLAALQWEMEVDEEGMVKVSRSPVAGTAFFAPWIVFTDKTDRDIIRHCVEHEYIDEAVGRTLAGPGRRMIYSAFTNLRQSRNARTRTQLPPIPLDGPRQAHESFLEAAKEDPELMAATIFGPEVARALAAAPVTQKWTGSMSTLYDPAEGSFELFRWDGEDHREDGGHPVIDVSNPSSLNSFLEAGGIQDGYLQPIGKSAYLSTLHPSLPRQFRMKRRDITSMIFEGVPTCQSAPARYVQRIRLNLHPS